MRAQAREQGRYLGGRPPYGYRLVDAGAHPNRAHAQWGRRLQKLDPDRATAPRVVWMFAQRLTGRSIAGIARATRAMQAYLRWRNANTRDPGVLAAQRRERARVRSERQRIWGQRPTAHAA